MKKLLLFIMTLSCFTAYSQFGFRAGVTNYHSEMYDDLDFSVGFYAGIFSRIDMGGVGLRPEINFYQQATMQKIDFFGVDIKSTQKVNFIDFGTNFEFFVSDGFSILVGPTFHYVINGKTKATADGDEISEGDLEFDYLDFAERLALVLNVGISYNFSDNILMDVRYERTMALGLNDWDFDMDGISSGSIKAGVGFMF